VRAHRGPPHTYIAGLQWDKQQCEGPGLAGEDAMDEVQDGLTIGAIFAAAVASHGGRPFLAVPPNASRSYLPDGIEITYAEAAARIAELAAIYRAAGYGLGHRVATLLENRPEYVLHKFALNAIGACCVPINPDYRAGETAYLLEHCRPDLILTLASRLSQVSEALAQSSHRAPTIISDTFDARSLVQASRPAQGG